MNVSIEVKNNNFFHTNVRTNKLELLPEFESISGSQYKFTDHYHPYL